MKKNVTSVFELPVNGRVMIEANAGTGKTYTIAALYVRLIIEKSLTVDQLLVMTFTRKATAELRGRIFKRLKESLGALEKGEHSGEDLFLAELIQKAENRQFAADVLKRAIENFDENQITTIHGFCQKVLKEEALYTGTMFDFEVRADNERQRLAAEEFWRGFIAKHQKTEAGRYYINKMLQLAQSPGQLQSLLHPLFAKPYAEIEAETLADPVAQLNVLIEQRREMKNIWSTARDEIMPVLHDSPVSRYQTHLQSRVEKLEDFLDDEMFSDDTFPQLTYFSSEYLYNPENYLKARKGESHEKHRFFESCTAYLHQVKKIEKLPGTLLKEAHEEISRIMEILSSNTEAISYDDLLKLLSDALENGNQAEKLAARLRASYPAALVDEFQDTDPLQYSILNCMYNTAASFDEALYMIGDPKQAIYAFRGADVYTYFRAKRALEHSVYTLEKNYRSTANIIHSVNTLFGRQQGLFYEKEIGFFDSEKGEAPHQHVFTIDGRPADTFRFVMSGGMEANKTEPKERFFDYTAGRISRLLSLAAEGRAAIGEKPLEAGDISVLVNSHRDAAAIKKKLNLLGIDSVVYSKQNVLTTFEAVRLKSVLEGILHPFSRRHMNRALLSGFFGLDLADLYEMKETDARKQLLSARLAELQEIWKTRGIYYTFRKLLFENEAIISLSKLNDSERILTNLFHLAEILSGLEQENGFSPEELFRRFVHEIHSAEQDEEKALLLESDRKLVMISTIHNSKGLQYPVVFCPSLWEAARAPGALPEYHSQGDLSLSINLDQYTSDQRKTALEKSMEEAVAEEIRKAYVAVTRAEYYCEVMWASHKDAWQSGLGLPLLGTETFYALKKGEADPKKELEEIALEAIDGLAVQSGSTIKKIVLEREMEGKTGELAFLPVSGTENKPVFEPYKGRQTLDVKTRINSFTSLARGGKADPFEPDYDQALEHYAGAFRKEEPDDGGETIFTFPKGATPGTAIHKFFEQDDFSFTDAAGKDYSRMIKDILLEFGIEQKWEPVFRQMVKDVAGAKIPGLNLAAAGNNDLLKEMEFYFTTRSAQVSELISIIRNTGGEVVQPEHISGQGFMTGFIDLVVRQNHQFFILDYKSNFLGSSPDDYSGENLQQEILHSYYDLQYHIYTVALVKYLRGRVPGFRYEEHFGGVAYLFVRGMQAGTDHGIWFHKPEEAVIQKLENYLEGKKQ